MPPGLDPDPQQSRSDVLSLLIVEDELPTVFAMREFFTHTGYRVDCAAGLTDAMALLERNRYDVIITDLHLSPKRCGEGMTVLAWARPRNPRARIIMLTAFASEASEREACCKGVDLYQTKPVRLAELAAHIEAGRNEALPARRAGNGEDWGGGCPQ